LVAGAYRRGFYAAGAAITQAATELPQDQLFEHLVSIGRERRTATERLNRITGDQHPANTRVGAGLANAQRRQPEAEC